MSDSGRAVFLSYASEDAAAAQRVCAALRAAGVEVWFDQSELVGGDAWDQKIRRQIKECALLIPIISAATQARTEGYFRLEWRLADQRTHLMAKGRPFLLPVVSDDTREDEAHVPDSFTEVQWTRLPGGETPPAFAQRVKKLLNAETVADSGAPARTGAGSRLVPSTPAAKKFRWTWLLLPWVSVGITIGLVYGLRPLWQPARPHPAPPPAMATAVESDIARLRANLRPDEWTRADFDAITPTFDRLIEAHPENGDAWALRSIANSLLVIRNLDSGTKPLEIGREAADRALRLAPHSPLAELSLGLHLTAMNSRGGDRLAPGPHIERALAGLPANETLVRYADLVSRWLGYQFEPAEKSAQAWLAAEPHASFPAWILAQSAVARRSPAEAEKWGERAATDPDITGVRALVTMFEARYYLQADLVGARALLDRVPSGQRGVHRVVASRFLLALAEKHFDLALQELAHTPESMLRDRVFHGPKAMLAAMAQTAAGRAEAGQAQFREAERVLREELAHDPDNQELRSVLALDLAFLARPAEAHGELAVVEPLLGGQEPSVYTGQILALMAQTHGVLGEIDLMIPWLRRLLQEPSSVPFSPASLRLDPRFAIYCADPRVQALLGEFVAAAPASAAAVDGKSVAVLAFANLSDDKANEYFSDGISEELLNVLAKVPGLKVTARTSSFHFKGKDTPIPEIAQQLGVAYVVEGSVRKSGDKVRITAQLIKAADGFHVWSDTFTRDLKDIFAVQDEIAGLIANNLQLTLGAAPRLAKTVNPEGHRLVLEGRYFWNQRNEDAYARAEAVYLHALELDPEYAEAHAGLADVWAIRGWYRIMAGNAGQAAADFARAKEEVRRAQALNPALAEPYATLGVVLMNEFKFEESERQFAQAIALNPNYAVARHWHACLLDAVGRLDESLREIEQSLGLDPLSPNALWQKAVSFGVAGRRREALDAAERALALRPVHPTILSIRAKTLWELGRRDEAIAAARAVGRDLTAQPRWLADANAIYVLGQAGLPSEAEDYAARALANVPKDDYRYGTTLVALGRGKEALTYLRKLPATALANVYWHPMWDSLREDAQFQSWLALLGCAEQYKLARETQARMLKEQAAKK